jgi:hypothetical protein
MAHIVPTRYYGGITDLLHCTTRNRDAAQAWLAGVVDYAGLAGSRPVNP